MIVVAAGRGRALVAERGVELLQSAERLDERFGPLGLRVCGHGDGDGGGSERGWIE